MKKKLIWIISIIIIIIGGILIIRSRKKGPAYQLVEVEKGNVVQTVSVTGTVTSAKEIDLQFENAGKIRELNVVVGDKVTVGQVLTRLDSGELYAQLQSKQAALEVAQAQLAQTLAGSRPEDIQVYETAVVSAEVDLENKKQALIDAQEDAENDLAQSYEDVSDILNDAYNKASDAVYKQIDDLFDNDETNPDLSFNTSDSQAENEAESQRALASDELKEFQSELAVLDIKDYDNLDDSLDEAKDHLNVVRDLLTTVMDTLNGAINVPAATLSTYKKDVTTARTNINTALTDITDQEQTIATTKIDNQTDINDAQADVDDAEVDLQTAKDQLALKKAAPLQADIDLSEAKVKQARADIAQIQEKINKTVLTTPIDGFVTFVDKEIGETAQAGATMISIIGIDYFQIEANVSETEIAKVNLSDEVEMTLDALGPDEKFSGRIVKIDPAETVVSGVIYYKITSVFDIKDDRIKSGMTANLEIFTDKKENVLILPYYAVHQINGRSYVEVLADKKAQERDVKTGLEGETMIEIIEGVSQGEKIIVFREEE